MDFVYDFEAKVNKYSEICEHRNIFIPPQRSGEGLIVLPVSVLSSVLHTL